MMEEKGWLDRYLVIIHRMMAIIAAMMVIFLMLAISYSVMVRYFLNRPVAWIVEISSYLMLYITFLGTAWLLRRDGHVEIDLFTSHLSPKTKAVFKSLTSIGGAVVGFILAWKGALVTLDYFRRGVTPMGILNTPQFLLMAIIPVGGFLLMVEFILRTIRFGRIGFKKDEGLTQGS
ncbi:MAG: TRAP transporter small permease [Deltaproteobacteria bacterium]|nr:TRAP transporter small permease [Deltaproteobacteria bacterium]